MEIKVDWTTQTVLDMAKYPLGVLKYQFHFIQPIGNNFLLLGARCVNRKTGPDNNAWIVSRDGQVLSKFCLGDGIQNCVVKSDGEIITGYFDEGVFGNLGWGSAPIGRSGLRAWTSEGVALWENTKYPIYDCYALSLDAGENLWFYYYDDFSLVKTGGQDDLVLDPPLTGSNGFAVLDNDNNFLFKGGYQKQNKLYLLSRTGQSLGNEQEVTPSYNGHKVAIKDSCLLRPQMLFLSKDNVVYGGTFNPA